MKKRIILLGLVAVLCAPSLLSGLAEAMEPDSVALLWDVIGGGNGSGGSASYAVQATIGQAATGALTGESYQAEVGFWHKATLYKIYLPVVLNNQS